MINNRKIKLSIVEIASHELALSYAGKMLVDFGFNVIKIGKGIQSNTFDRNKKYMRSYAGLLMRVLKHHINKKL